jgi:hypothetical protein
MKSGLKLSERERNELLDGLTGGMSRDQLLEASGPSAMQAMEEAFDSGNLVRVGEALRVMIDQLNNRS